MDQDALKSMKTQVEQLDIASATLRGLIQQGKAPDARQIVNLLVLAVSHEQWVRGMFGGLVSQIRDDEPQPFGGGAIGNMSHIPQALTNDR
jgi:hypothetical protein